MKKMKLLLAFVAALFCGSIQAQSLSANDVMVMPGGTATLSVSVAFSQKPWSVEFNLDLPSVVSTVGTAQRGEVLTSDKHVVEQNGTKVGAYPSDYGEDVFGATSGVVAIFTLVAPPDATPGTYTGTIKNGAISDLDGNNYNCPDATFTITIPGPTGINSVGGDNAAKEVYNLNGQRVEGKTLSKGVYVVNGKKVTVK